MVPFSSLHLYNAGTLLSSLQLYLCIVLNQAMKTFSNMSHIILMRGNLSPMDWTANPQGEMFLPF